MKRGGALVLVVFAALQGVSVRAQDPLTPGRLALLADDQQDGSSTDALRRSLADSRGEMRALAARIVGLTARRSLYKELVAALERETDGPAAAQQVHAMLYLQGSAALPPVRAAVERLPQEPLLALADWLARSDAAQFVSASDMFRKAGEAERQALVMSGAVAAKTFPDHRGPITEAVASFATGGFWRDYLTSVNWNANELVAIRAGLNAADAEVREQTVWWAVAVADRGRELPPDMTSALVTPVRGDTTWAGVGRELWNRRIAKGQQQDLSASIASSVSEHMDDIALVAAAADLSPAERTAADKAVSQGSGRTSMTTSESATPPSQVSTLRLIQPVSPGLLADVFNAAGCRYGDATVAGAARITYWPDGRPKQITVADTLLRPACARALRVLAILTTAAADEPVLPDTSQWILMPTSKEIAACIDDARLSSGPLRRAGAKVGAPKKTRTVDPIYPVAAQKGRVQGLVIIDSLISESGCVKSAKVVRSAHPALDLAAMNSVIQWRFTPTRLDDRAVPVLMTVTVNFTLQ